jgi:hypothetical protein
MWTLEILTWSNHIPFQENTLKTVSIPLKFLNSKHLEENIKAGNATGSPQILSRVCINTEYHFDDCQAANGAHFELY